MKPASPIRAIVATSFLALSLCQLSAADAPVFAAVANPDGAAAQEPAGFGPLDPTPPSGVTTDEIIKKFGEREAAFKKARDNYTFRQTVKVDTLAEDTNRVDGEYQQVTDITFNADGKREEHVVFAPQNTLERVMMSPSDFDEIEHRLPFILTTEDQPKYKIDYLGRQHVDELNTYVFSVTPKTFEKNQHYFQGKIWVDQQDFQIVLINGKTVPAGEYSVFIDVKTPTDWTFILSNWPAQTTYDPNNKAALWGSFGYTPDKDVVRAAMRVSQTATSVDELTWLFVDVTPAGGSLEIAWDKTVALVPFKVGA